MVSDIAWAQRPDLILLALLSVGLLVIAVIDLRTYRIANKANLAIAAGAPLMWWAQGLSLPAIGVQVAVALAVFLVCALLFRLGQMGGGDVKLASALALWFTATETFELLVVMALVGGVMTLFVAMLHKARRRKDRAKVAYGVAIVAGALWVIAQRFLNQ
jgi:prepilin peptidase CpaA